MLLLTLPREQTALQLRNHLKQTPLNPFHVAFVEDVEALLKYSEKLQERFPELDRTD